MTSAPPTRIDLPFSVLAKPAGAACNLDCGYCFFLSKDLLYDKPAQEMSEDGLRTYLENLFASSPEGEVEVAWQGGEPTLRGLPFFARAVELARGLARPGQTVRHAIQTNGTRIDDTWAAFLAEHGFLVGLSIDGPPGLHDAYRVNKAGRGTYAQVERAWRTLTRHDVAVNVLCTVHAANQDSPLEVYRHFRDELGARHLQFIPIVERVPLEDLEMAEGGWRPDGAGRRTLLYRQDGNAVTSRSVDPGRYGEFLVAVFDEWAAHDVGEVFVQDFDVAVGNRLGIHTLCVHAPECGRALAVEHNGDVYSCDHYVEPGYRLGNVAEDSLQTMLQSPAQREFGASKRTDLPSTCVECPVRWACHGGCPKDRFAASADGEPGLNHLCEGYFRFYTHAQPLIDRMATMLKAGRPAADALR